MSIRGAFGEVSQDVPVRPLPRHAQFSIGSETEFFFLLLMLAQESWLCKGSDHYTKLVLKVSVHIRVVTLLGQSQSTL